MVTVEDARETQVVTTPKRRQRKRSSEYVKDLFEQHADSAFRFAYVLTSDRETAEDLVQEAFVRVVGRLGSLRQPDSFRAYLNKAVLNLARGIARQRQRENEALLRLARIELPDDPPAHEEQDRRLWQALMSLPPRQRAVIYLRFYEDLSQTEVAHLLDTSIGSIKSLTYRALNVLRDVFADGGRDEQR